MEPSEYDELLRRLIGLLVVQHEKNQSYDAIIQEQRSINARLTAAIERLDTTQARIETLLARMIPPAPNGREA